MEYKQEQRRAESSSFPQIGIGLMYLQNIRSTIVPLATPIPPALLSCCISNNYQLLILLQHIGKQFKSYEKRSFRCKQNAFCPRTLCANKNKEVPEVVLGLLAWSIDSTYKGSMKFFKQKDKNCCFESSN